MVRKLVCWMMFALLLLPAVVGAQEQAPEEAPPLPVAGDQATLWSPTAVQLAAWVSEGFTAAGMDLETVALPVVDRMTWSNTEGSELPGGRTLRFAGLMTPELVSTLAGYSSAWEEETWTRIQEAPDTIAAELATSLRPSLTNGTLTLPFALSGPEYADMKIALHYEGQWRKLEAHPWKGMTELDPEALTATMNDPLWATMYLLASAASLPPFQPSDQVRIYLCTWSRAAGPADADFAAALPEPEWSGTKYARLAIGDATLFAWVDFELP